MKVLLILFILIVTSCSSTKSTLDYKKIFSEAIDGGQCSVAQQTIPLERDQGGAMSLVESSGAYILTVGITPVTGFIDIMLMGRCQYGGCKDEEKNLIKAMFPTSYFLWSKTDNHRCPDNSYYVNKLVDTVECYLEHKTEKSQKAGHLLIKHLYEKSNMPLNCITVKDKKRINNVYIRSTI